MFARSRSDAPDGAPPAEPAPPHAPRVLQPSTFASRKAAAPPRDAGLELVHVSRTRRSIPADPRARRANPYAADVEVVEDLYVDRRRPAEVYVSHDGGPIQRVMRHAVEPEKVVPVGTFTRGPHPSPTFPAAPTDTVRSVTEERLTVAVTRPTCLAKVTGL